MSDILSTETLASGFKMLIDAPQAAIPLVAIAAGFTWWLRGTLFEAKEAAITTKLKYLKEQEEELQAREEKAQQMMDTFVAKSEKENNQKATPSTAIDKGPTTPPQEAKGNKETIYESQQVEIVIFRPSNPPDLKFTQPQRIIIDGQYFEKPNWNPFMFEMIRQAATRIDREKLKALLITNFIDGLDGPEPAYRRIKEANLSVQGTNSPNCWRQIYKLARGANVPIEVEFSWAVAPGAAFPGLTGKFTVNATSL